jgi:hypothetical protein
MAQSHRMPYSFENNGVQHTEIFHTPISSITLNKLGPPPSPPLPLTSSAEIELRLLWNSLGDVDLGPQTRHTHVGGVRLNRCTTLAAKTELGRDKKKIPFVQIMS